MNPPKGFLLWQFFTQFQNILSRSNSKSFPWMDFYPQLLHLKCTFTKTSLIFSEHGPSLTTAFILGGPFWEQQLIKDPKRSWALCIQVGILSIADGSPAMWPLSFLWCTFLLSVGQIDPILASRLENRCVCGGKKKKFAGKRCKKIAEMLRKSLGKGLVRDCQKGLKHHKNIANIAHKRRAAGPERTQIQEWKIREVNKFLRKQKILKASLPSSQEQLFQLNWDYFSW